MLPHYSVLILSLSLISMAAESVAVQPQALSNKPELISIDSVNLTAARFWQAYNSADDTDKYAARFFLLGVMDATEGKTWCSYQQFKTISLRDYLNGYFNNLTESQLQLRAATVIETALVELNACKGNL